jgi:hypothetical protein
VPRNRDVYRYIKGVKSGAALPPKHAPRRRRSSGTRHALPCGPCPDSV